MEEHQEEADNEIKRLKAELKQVSRELADQSRLSEQDKPPSVRLSENSQDEMPNQSLIEEETKLLEEEKLKESVTVDPEESVMSEENEQSNSGATEHVKDADFKIYP